MHGKETTSKRAMATEEGPYLASEGPLTSLELPTVVGPQSSLGQSQSLYVQVQRQVTGPPKSLSTAYKYAIAGIFGAHHFYLGRPKFGVLYLFTAGLFLLGWIVDFCRMPLLVKQANKMRERPDEFKNKRTLLDAYVVWVPLGIFGAHHYYLGSMAWGVVYTFTIGLFGIGWLVDGIRMKILVEECNKKLANRPIHDATDDNDKKLSECYILGISPLGLLGAHHYYMERWMFAVMYTFTLGLFGVGWLVDIFTMPILFNRANKIRRGEVNPDHRYLGEAYKLIFPVGFLGLHHFYLRRPGWGILYFCTLGCFLIGWIIDFFRLPSLVRAVNDAVDKEAANLQELQQRLGSRTQVVQVAMTGYPVNSYPANSYPVHIYPDSHPPPQYTPAPYMGPSIPASYLPHLQNETHSSRPPPYTAVMSPMDVITEEDEETSSIGSPPSHDNTRMFYDNALNEQINSFSKAGTQATDL